MWREGENSGLNLRWYRGLIRTNPILAQDGAEETFSSYGGFGPIAWLDREKLAALGFNVVPPGPVDTDTHYNRILGRDVLLVLELDGPVHAPRTAGLAGSPRSSGKRDRHESRASGKRTAATRRARSSTT